MSEAQAESQVLPEFYILRGESELVETRHFRPTDLLTIVIRNTGDWRSTQVTMTDEIGQNRYGGMSSGMNHVLTTRLQNTRSYGDWLLHVEGPLMDSERIFQINLVFHIVEELHHNSDEKKVEIFKDDNTLEVKYIIEASSQSGVVLQSINGIGPTYANRLHEADIYSVSQLLNYSPEKISEISKAKLKECRSWIEQATSLVG